MGKKWTEAQRAKFKATMTAKRETPNSVKRTPREQPEIIYQMTRGGRLERLRLRTVKVYVPD